jgi:hypothetical protein
MRKKFFIAGIVILVLLIIGGSWGWYKYNKPHQGVKGIKASASLDATALYGAFQADETKANTQYLGKVLEVRGKVTSVSLAPGSLGVQLDAGGSAQGGISCGMTDKDKTGLAKVSKDTYVTVKGRCTGYLMDVNLVDCEIEQIEQ